MSSQPQDGDVNVATPATFVLTFSAPLDTSARFAEPEDFFLGLDPSTGDAIGLYDANGDNQPDPIVISGGNSVAGMR